ncbi:DMT family transporter [Sinorhizobium meliloti]|uniref:DMT family transporter n=1 Tax=Rhizobium meliloti TaxID=382 RepID=UPI000FDB38C9|nr:DMT family transporter [Sinorhizobium meliloti]RVM17885.1 DMT family transporter [Sinorhizobium meliloti]RVO34205.1 DMT family transporter [Sinorhizobium meliloti]
MSEVSADSARTRILGIGLALVGYSFFAAQDALVKWLVVDYTVPQILFFRSLVVVGVLRAFVSRRASAVTRSGSQSPIFFRAVLVLFAWLLYYTAARYLSLVELTTMYFMAPVFVVVLSAIFLHEQVGLGRWISCLIGFAGVIIAANLGGAPSLVPAILVLFASMCWAWSVVLARVVAQTQGTTLQMLAISLVFLIACAPALPFLWKTPTYVDLWLLVGVGLASAVGQFFLYESFRYAPASAIATVEYSSLAWAFLYGHLIWAEPLSPHMILGSTLICLACFALLCSEHLAHKQRG